MSLRDKCTDLLSKHVSSYILRKLTLLLQDTFSLITTISGEASFKMTRSTGFIKKIKKNHDITPGKYLKVGILKHRFNKKNK